MTSRYAAPVGFDTAAIGRWRFGRSDRRGGRGGGLRLVLRGAAVVIALIIVHADVRADTYYDAGIGSQSQRRPPPHQWTTFVHVDGQPEPVPAEWVATPEGRFAHSLKIPDPVPKDSGYRWWMSSKDYFKHLCDTEAGEFIYDKVENVEGFLFMRPPGRPSDSDLMDKYKLEAPGFEAPYQLSRDSIEDQGTIFVAPPYRRYLYIEQPKRGVPDPGYLVASGYKKHGGVLSVVELKPAASSGYAVTWRGLRRANDRRLGISGVEVIALERRSGKVLAVWREYFQSIGVANSAQGVWWLSSVYCARSHAQYRRPDFEALYGYVIKVLSPPRLRTGEATE